MSSMLSPRGAQVRPVFVSHTPKLFSPGSESHEVPPEAVRTTASLSEDRAVALDHRSHPGEAPAGPRRRSRGPRPASPGVSIPSEIGSCFRRIQRQA